ncbi:MAG TPA: hypothetical protein VK175_04825 [Leadbetterella sp.]|nr:hypothetical protein [Leadbetterella sp.]
MKDSAKFTGYNSTLAIGGVSSPLNSFVVAESFVLRMNICTEKPTHRKSANRWATYKKPTAQTAHLVFADTQSQR